MVKLFKKIKLKATLYFLCALMMLSNNLLLSFTQQESFILQELKNNYSNEISKIEQELSQFDAQEIMETTIELSKKIVEITKETENSKNLEEQQLLKNQKYFLEQKYSKIIKLLQYIELQQSKINNIKKEISSFDLAAQVLDYATENKNNKENLNVETIKDLELFSTINSKPKKSLFQSLDKTKTYLGKVRLALELNNKKSKEKLEQGANQIKVLLENQDLLEQLEKDLNKTSVYTKNFLNNIEPEIKSLQANLEFLQNSEDKFSYYLNNSLKKTYYTTTNKLAVSTILMTIPLLANKMVPTSNTLSNALPTKIKNAIPTQLKNAYSFLSDNQNSNGIIENISQSLKQSFSYKNFVNWKLYTAFATQKGIQKIATKLPIMLNIASSFALQAAVAKYIGIPMTAFNLAMAPLYGIVDGGQNLKEQYTKKQIFKNSILQKLYELKLFIENLEKLNNTANQCEPLKKLTKNINKLVKYDQNDELGVFIKLIQKDKNYDEYKEKEIINSLYKTYISIFIKQEKPEYKKLILKALKDVSKVDVLLSKLILIKEKNFTMPEYMEKEGKPYIYMKNAKNPLHKDRQPIAIQEQNQTQEDQIFEFNEHKIKGFDLKEDEDKLNEKLKTFACNIIISNLGLIYATDAKITPVDHIFTMLDGTSLDCFKNTINNSQNLIDNQAEAKSIFLINNKKLEELLINKDSADFNKYKKHLDLIYQDVFNYLKNSYFLFTK